MSGLIIDRLDKEFDWPAKASCKKNNFHQVAVAVNDIIHSSDSKYAISYKVADRIPDGAHYHWQTKIIDTSKAASGAIELERYKGLICFLNRRPHHGSVLKIVNVAKNYCLAIVGYIKNNQFIEETG